MDIFKAFQDMQSGFLRIFQACQKWICKNIFEGYFKLFKRGF